MLTEEASNTLYGTLFGEEQAGNAKPKKYPAPYSQVFMNRPTFILML